jgi:hypothetical protein
VSCLFNVTINDFEDPIITCPTNKTVDNDVGFCSAIVNYDPATAIDNCVVDIVDLTIGIMSGDLFPVGSTTNIFNANDTNGNDGKSKNCLLSF